MKVAEVQKLSSMLSNSGSVETAEGSTGDTAGAEKSPGGKSQMESFTERQSLIVRKTWKMLATDLTGRGACCF